jgi:FkbM family methyltransferase
MRLPGPLQRAADRVVARTRLTDGRASARELIRLRSIPEHTSEGETVVAISLAPLDGRTVQLREGTADIDTLWDVFVHRYHLPPRSVGRGMRLIWDLGANIGLTMADMAHRYHSARVVGVELDGGNAALAERNLRDWSDRTEVIQAAAWPVDGETWYHRWPGATSAFFAHVPTPGEEPQGPVVPTLSLDALLERTGGPVDYAKVDIEGAEREVLAHNTDWAASVRCIKVEVHRDYTTADCVRDLERLGFDASRDRRHGAAVIGVRDVGE